MNNSISAVSMAAAVRVGQTTPLEMVEAALARAEAASELNIFTFICADRARQRAVAMSGQNLSRLPLAGVPFAVKNLFDIQGIATLAGSKINADNAPARRDALAIERLEAAGAILIGALNMGEYAYDFTGENAHHGNCRNPLDPTRMPGGSSSGSAAAVAAGIVPFTLGSDTNGSIRVPASFCGIFGLKPTYGRLPRCGVFPFVDSLDHIGPFAAHLDDLALVYDCLQGYDARDRAAVRRPMEPITNTSRDAPQLRIAQAGGYFDTACYPAAAAAMASACKTMGITETVTVPLAAEGRAAAYLITNVEGGALHLPRLRQRARDFDADTRSRLIAGGLLPAEWYIAAQRTRARYTEAIAALFTEVDVLVAPATPTKAPLIGQKTLTLNNQEVLLRPNMGYFTQPFSAAGLPAMTVPIPQPQGEMPIGVQVVAAPWCEHHCLAAAQQLLANSAQG